MNIGSELLVAINELVDMISSERDALVAANASERMQEEQRMGNLTRTARAQFDEKMQKKKTKPKGKTKAKTTRPAKSAQEEEGELGRVAHRRVYHLVFSAGGQPEAVRGAGAARPRELPAA